MFFFPRRIALISALSIIAATPPVNAQKSRKPARIEAIRFWAFGDVTRIAVETSGQYKFYSEQISNPARVYFDLSGIHPPSSIRKDIQTIPVGDHRIRQIRVARITDTKTRIVLDLDCPVQVSSSQLVNPDRLMIEIRPKGSCIATTMASNSVTGSQKFDAAAPTEALADDIPDAEQAPTLVAKTTSSDTLIPPPIIAAPVPSPLKKEALPDRSLVRIFGLKLGRVVIDAGHGGHDSGTTGPNGLEEKELVLDVALRLGALITKQLGAEVVYTRSTDVFIPLEQRTKIANDQKADLFISIHANASSEPTATGVETYYFNLTSDRKGLDLATRENSTSGSAISDLNDLLHRAVLQTKKEESRDFAQKVQASLTAAAQKTNTHVRDRGVRQAPFIVLIGATMPSVLAEIGFVSNPHDEKLFRKAEQRQRIADALFKGVTQYANSLGHLQMARATDAKN